MMKIELSDYSAPIDGRRIGKEHIISIFTLRDDERLALLATRLVDFASVLGPMFKKLANVYTRMGTGRL